MVHADKNNFKSEIASGEVLVDFWAPWCGPCQMMAEVLEEMEEKMPNIKIVKVNVDNEQQLAIEYGISSIPAFLLFKDGELKAQTLGYMPLEQLKSRLGL